MNSKNLNEDVIKIFKDININLNKFNITAWMDAGLLLKYTRGQSLFPSSDIDFGVKPEDINKLLLFAKFMENKDYLVTSTGNISVAFEGLNLIKKIKGDKYITTDIHIYYPLENYYCRPNSHKPLKQSYLSRNLFRIFNKLNIIFNSKYIQEAYVVKKLFMVLYLIYSKIYFQIALTSQFGIPKVFFEKFKYIKLYNQKILIPKNNIKYIEWRYGSNWSVPNKNWRLTDGNMVFLSNLKQYWFFFRSAPIFMKSKYFMERYNIYNKKKLKANNKSVFIFDDEEIKIIKKSQIFKNTKLENNE